MADRGKRIAVEGDVLDRIGNLPSNVITHILDFLTLKEIGRTSVLSTKWRYIWTSHPNIKIGRNTLLPRKRKKVLTLSSFSSIINKILLQRTGPVLKFDLEFPLFTSTNNFDFCFVNHWLLYLSRNGIRKLTIKFSSQVPYTVPSHIFTYPHFKVLNFSNCIFNSPNGHAEFRKLNNMCFCSVNFQSSEVSSALKTPQLTYLCFKSCTGVYNFKIRAPKLKTLVLDGSGDVDFIGFDMLSSSELKVLKVSSCIFKVGHVEFRNLDSFYFYDINFRSSKVTVDTPQLKYLSFKSCAEVFNFKIHAPKLKTLVLDASGDVDLIGFEMAEITTIAVMGGCTLKKIRLTKLFEKCRLISALYVCGSSFKYVVADLYLERLRSMTICLKHLVLKDVNFGDFHEISCIMHLLRSSTALSRLEISAGVPTQDKTNDVLNKLYAAYEYWMISRLEVVIIENARGSEDEMHFIKLLLSSTPRLKKMFVQERHVYYDPVAKKLSKYLMRFPRASTKAEIILEPNVKIARPPSVG